MAINQLEILARRDYFSMPTYKFTETHDKNGNPLWKCECHITEEDKYFQAKSSGKKEAKKDAAWKMLKHVLEWNESLNNQKNDGFENRYWDDDYNVNIDD